MTASTLPAAPARSAVPLWARGLAAFGVLWSLYGVFQFAGSSLATEATLMGRGMTEAQAQLYAGLPVWMTVVFAVGVFGGVIGSALLFFGRRQALPVLAASLAGYVALYAGDVAYGVFEAFGPSQVAVLTFVVLVAAALFGAALRLGRTRGLR
jgi:hypothetical protein